MPSWVDKELKKRSAAAPVATAAGAADDGAAAAQQIAALWQRIVDANRALPDELRLEFDEHPLPAPAALPGPRFLAWLRAPNGAALGLTGDAIRYLWPDPAQGKKSHNFWIRATPQRGLVLTRRIGGAMGMPNVTEYRFDERRIDGLLRSLVTGRRVTRPSRYR